MMDFCIPFGLSMPLEDVNHQWADEPVDAPQSKKVYPLIQD